MTINYLGPGEPMTREQVYRYLLKKVVVHHLEQAKAIIESSKDEKLAKYNTLDQGFANIDVALNIVKELM